MNLFEYDDYRKFISESLEQMPRGSKTDLSLSIGIHSTTLSQILKGEKSLTLEHGILAAEFFGLNESQSEYFILLIQLDRAGNQKLRKLFRTQVEKAQAESSDLKKILPKSKKISASQQTIFYSHWIYSAIRVLASIPEFQTIDALAKRLHLLRKEIMPSIEFLVEAELCVLEGQNISTSPKYTHLEARSPMIARHHSNWRLRSMDRHPFLEDPEMAYSAPMSISNADAIRIRNMLQVAVREIQAIRDPSPCESAWVLGIDWTKLP